MNQSPQPAVAHSTPLYAAAAAMPIPSPAGLRMAGFGARLEGAIGSHDPLLARVLWLRQGEVDLLWIACDLIGFATDVDAALREQIATRAGIASGNVLISCSHTHGSMESITFRGPLGAPDPTWLEQFGSGLADFCATLPAQLGAVELRIAATEVLGLGYNRQDVGQPTDESLALLAFDAIEDGRRVATVLNYAMHPVILGETNRYYTADYPGFACASVERQAGGVALWIQGACGDVDPANYRDDGRTASSFELAEAAGERLANAAVEALSKAIPEQNVTLAIAEQTVDLPMDPSPSLQALSQLRATFVRDRGDPALPPEGEPARWSLFQMQWADELARAIASDAVPQTFALRVSAVRIGGMRIIAIPAEVYAAIGLELKRRLMPWHVMIAAYTGGAIGYIPTDHAKRQGGYGPAISHRFFAELLTPVGWGAQERLVEGAVALARSLDVERVHGSKLAGRV